MPVGASDAPLAEPTVRVETPRYARMYRGVSATVRGFGDDGGQGTMSPAVFSCASWNRRCTSSQFTISQNAFT